MSEEDKKLFANAFALLWWKLYPDVTKLEDFKEIKNDFEYLFGVVDELENKL